jgi:glycosyltransferase involved in cell wall biosynthesis
VIIPTYDRPRPLSACLRALAEQRFSRDRFEVVVVDDGGRESCEQVVAAFRESLRICSLRQRNRGPAAARNAGARTAGGRFLAFTDDDCEPEPEWLASLDGALRCEPGVMVGGRTVNSLPDDPCSRASQFIQDFVYAHYNPDPRGARFFASNNMAMAASGFSAVQGFDAKFRTSEDRDICDRWYRSGRSMIYVPEAVVRHSHRTGLFRYWMQHVGYGRGARRFLVHRNRRDPNSPFIEAEFYRKLLTSLPAVLRSTPRPCLLAFLLFLWQMANVTGFALETVLPLKSANCHREEANEEA